MSIDIRRRRGAGLLEMVLAIAVAALIGVSAVSAINEMSEQQRVETSAQKMGEIVAASKNYLKANTERLLEVTEAASPVLVPIARTTTGAEPFPASAAGLTSLQAGGFLPSSYVDNNPYGQHHALVIRKNNGNRLEAMVVAVGGRNVAEDSRLGQIAARIGAEGGFMANQPLEGFQGMVTGAAGGWGAVGSEWTVGGVGPTQGRAMASMALDEGAIVADYLYRRDIGIPEANKMRTDLSMGGNDINDIRDLNDVRSIVSNGKRIDVNRDSFLSLENGVARIQMAADGTIDIRNNSARLRMASDGTINLGRDVIVDQDVTARRNVSADAEVSAGTDVIAQRLIDRDDRSKVIDPSATSEITNLNASGGVNVNGGVNVGGHLHSGSLSTGRFNLNAMAEGVVHGALRPNETVGQLATRLHGCMLEYRFTNSGQTHNPNAQWVSGVRLDGTSNTGPMSRWGARKLDNECNGSGCAVQMRINCTPSETPPPVTPPYLPPVDEGEACPQIIGMSGTYPNCVYTPAPANECPPWTSGPFPNCVPRAGSGNVDVQVVTESTVAFRFPIVSVQCPAGRTVVGGGGDCSASFTMQVANRPEGNGWFLACNSADRINVPATVYALCAR